MALSNLYIQLEMLESPKFESIFIFCDHWIVIKFYDCWSSHLFWKNHNCFQ